MVDLNKLSLHELLTELMPDDAIDRLLSIALEEDLGDGGDVTSRALVAPDRLATARLVPRRAGVIAGLGLFSRIRHPAFAEIASSINVHVSDGHACSPGQAIAELSGRLRSILAAERTILNLLGHLSGVASLTARYVHAIEGTQAAICDTRKTLPGLRRLEKYAVRCGGGTTHRLGLFDAMLIKDNHLAALDGADLANALSEAVRKARQATKLAFVEVEVDSIEQLRQVLQMANGLVDMILLDNMPPRTLRAAVAMRDDMDSAVLLEASGGVNLRNVRAVAETGVDRISVGAITHSAPVLDIGLDLA